MNLKQLQYFLVVAQEHQITAAAKLLYTSQPPLSYQLKQLEEELGVKLFSRTAHGIELTEEGEILQQYARQMLNLSDNIKEELHKGQDGTLGTVRLGLISSAGDLLFGNKLGCFTDYYPATKFEITEGNTYELTRLLNSGGIDLAIVRTPFNMQGLKKKEIKTDKMVAVYCASKFDAGKKTVDLNTLAGQPLILYRRFEALFNESFASQGLNPAYAVKCDDARTAILWADQGMGIALVPSSIAHLYAKETIVPIEFEPWNTTVQIVWKNGVKLRPIIQRFINSL